MKKTTAKATAKARKPRPLGRLQAHRPAPHQRVVKRAKTVRHARRRT